MKKYIVPIIEVSNIEDIISASAIVGEGDKIGFEDLFK